MPTVFISYSWDSDAHRAWVRRLAEDLRAGGVTVWLDQFELRPGDDVTHFMERGVSLADYVLLVCTERFGQKANERHGGVGYEQAIVSSEILNAHPSRGRFVCLLRQGMPSQSLPRYMQSRLWVDGRDDAAYAAALDQILRHFLGGTGTPAQAASTVGSSSPALAPAPPLRREPQRWVLVAGTGAQRGFTEKVEALSRTLGAGLVCGNFGLVTGGWAGVDEWVAKSFADTALATQVPLEDSLVQVIVDSDEPPFTAGQLVFVKKGKDEWDEPIRRADVVVLLGGLGGTMETGQRALKMKKAVLPIADTGGDAKAMYLQMLKNWPSLAWMGIEEKDFLRLGRPGPTALDAALELARKVRGAA